MFMMSCVTLVSTQIHGPVCLPSCSFHLASCEVSLTILTSTNVGENRRVFQNYPGPKNKDDIKNEVDLKNEDELKNEDDLRKEDDVINEGYFGNEDYL